MTTIEVVHSFESCNHVDSFESFKIIFAKFYHPNKYIYLSLGSKYNEPTVLFGKKECRTNARLQLYPQFLQEHALYPEKEILVISIDHYDESHIEINRQVVQSRVNDNPRVKVILYDTNITIQMIPHLFGYICDVMKDADPLHCMIANYIRFMHPNHTENYLEEHLPDAILGALSDRFKPRFYQWFVYHPNLYNTLYCYYRNRYLMGLTSLVKILSDTLGSNRLSAIYAKDVFDVIAKHPHKKMMCILWNTFVDIKGGINSHDICPDFSQLQF